MAGRAPQRSLPAAAAAALLLLPVSAGDGDGNRAGGAGTGPGMERRERPTVARNAAGQTRALGAP